jgi:hypothetical protein
MEGVGRQNWARGPIPIFRKIHLYGKSAKSTHGHTNEKPTWPGFSDLALFRLPRLPRTYPGASLHQRALPWGALVPRERKCAAYPGALFPSREWNAPPTLEQ